MRLYANQTIFHVSLEIQNRKKTAMDLMYLAHINFRPIDHAQLLTTAPATPEAIRVRRSIPSHISPPQATANLSTCSAPIRLCETPSPLIWALTPR
jgi:hypothetical protein